MPALKWFKSPAMDAPELNSPQPCHHGAGCNYKRKNKAGELVPACCSFVHPGEEGNGRRLFAQRTWYEGEEDPVIGEPPAEGGKITRVDPACVRLTGRAGYYERRRLRLSWAEWCAREGIAYTANAPGVVPPPLQIVAIGRRPRDGPYRGVAPVEPVPEPQVESQPEQAKSTKNQRQRRNRKQRREEQGAEEQQITEELSAE